MAEFEEGTYYVVSVGSGLVMETKNATDEKGNNVDQYTNVAGDAQIWSVTDQGNGWQFICSLSNKCLNVYGTVAAGANVNVWDDNDSGHQRWSIVPDGGTYTYKNVSYDTFKVHLYAHPNLSLAVQGNSSALRANVQIATDTNSNWQRWAFVPAPVLTENGTYFICPALDPSMTLVANAGSTAAGANVFLWTMRDVNHQILRTSVDPETLNTKFFFAHSDKCLDIYYGSTAVAGRNVQQWTPNSSVAQLWLPTQNGTVKYNGETYPAYVLRAIANRGLALDTKDGKLTSGTNVLVNTRNWSNSQRFIFVKTEMLGSGIEMPGAIDQTEFHRDGIGDVTVTGLTFKSKEQYFQARYLIRKYNLDRSSYTDTSWMSTFDDSTSRSGWGDAWTYTFHEVPVEGKISMPFEPTVSLSEEYPSADLIIEVRTYKDSYGSGYKAHGPIRQSTIKITQTPEISVSSSKIFRTASSGELGFKTVLADSSGNTCSFVKGRILGENGEPISDWQTSSNFTISHILGKTLRRFPGSGESLSFEYILLTDAGLSDRGKIQFSMSYAESTGMTVEYDEGDSLTASIHSESTEYEHCFTEVPYFGDYKLVENKKESASLGVSTWKCIPPLNRDVRVVKIGSNDGDNWTYSEETVRMDSHLFIWNWTDAGSPHVYDASAAILINSDSPPDQTRKYTPDVKFNSPAGRVFPVAFYSKNVSEDMSIKGVVVDDGVKYQSAGPVANNTKLSNIRKLALLGSKGIHPIYRTPYGDWCQVAIESVDTSKNEMYLSSVAVTQRVVED